MWSRMRPFVPLLVLVGLCVVLTILNPNFMTWGNISRLSASAMVLLVLATGTTFVVLMGSIDLSIEGVMTFCGVLLSMLVLNNFTGNDYGLLAIVVVLCAGAAMGAVTGALHVYLSVPSFMTTLGIWFVGLGLANVLLGGVAVRVNDPMIRGLAIERFLGLPMGVWVAVGALLVGYFVQARTRFGRHVYALGGGEDIARLSGVSSRVTRIKAFALAGLFYALGGILAVAQLGQGSAQLGQGRLFGTLTAVVVGGTLLAGGRGGVFQSAIGVLIVAVVNNGMVLIGVSSNAQVGVQGLLILAAVSLAASRRSGEVVK